MKTKILYDLLCHSKLGDDILTIARVYIETSLRRDQFANMLLNLMSQYTLSTPSGFFMIKPENEDVRNAVTLDCDPHDAIIIHDSVVRHLYMITECLAIRCSVNIRGFSNDINTSSYELCTKLYDAKRVFEILEKKLLDEKILIRVSHKESGLFDIDLIGFDSNNVLIKEFEKHMISVENVVSRRSDLLYRVVIQVSYDKSEQFTEIHIFERRIETIISEYLYQVISMIQDLLAAQSISNKITTINNFIFINIKISKESCIEKTICSIDRVIECVNRALESTNEFKDGYLVHLIDTHKEKYTHRIPVNVYVSNKCHIKDILCTLFMKPDEGEKYTEAFIILKLPSINEVVYSKNKDGSIDTIEIKTTGSFLEVENWFNRIKDKCLDEVVDTLIQFGDHRMQKYSKILITPRYGFDVILSKSMKVIEVPVNSNNFDYGKLVEWILQKFPYYPDPPYPSDVPYTKHYLMYEKSDYVFLAIHLLPGCDYNGSLQDEFESHINNFILLKNIKKECEKEIVNFKFDFDTFDDKVINAVVVCKDDKRYLFIDDSTSDAAKKYMRDSVNEYEMICYDVPLFIIKMLKEKFPVISKEPDRVVVEIDTRHNL